MRTGACVLSAGVGLSMQAFSHEALDLAVCLEAGKLAKVGKTGNDSSSGRSRSLFRGQNYSESLYQVKTIWLVGKDQLLVNDFTNNASTA